MPDTIATDMEGKRRWIVTFAKHVKQKRKMFHDGFLELNSSTRKVALLDDTEKILECKYLVEAELPKLSPGETLLLNGYIVDVGNADNRSGSSCRNGEQPESKLPEKPRPTKRQKFRSPTFPTSAVHRDDDGMSPSRRIIREFMRKEIKKYVVVPKAESTSTLYTMKSNESEWYVFYTNQTTQKYKKYHDGFLKAATSGQLGMKVYLYDQKRQLLTNRFLKNDETIRSGDSLLFDGFLVDIGEQLKNEILQQESHDCTRNLGKVEKTGCHPEIITPVAHEWQVLYTKQLTKKTKSYQDGFIKVATCGLLGRQITLYDCHKRLLDSRFLQKDEAVATGASILLNTHLLDIGDAIVENAPTIISHKETIQTSFCKSRKANTKCISVTDGVKLKSSSMKPLRDANQILLTLQKPIPTGTSTAIVKGFPTKLQDSECSKDNDESAVVASLRMATYKNLTENEISSSEMQDDHFHELDVATNCSGYTLPVQVGCETTRREWLGDWKQKPNFDLGL